MTYMPPTEQQPPAPQPQHQYAPPPATPKGLAITALVVGIVAFLLGWVPVLGIIVGLAAVVFGIIALVKKQSKAFAITGLSLGAVGLIVSIFMTAALGAVGNEVSKAIEEADTSVESVEPDAAEPEPAPAETEEPAAEPQERLTLDDGWVSEPDEYGAFTVVKGYVSNNSDKAITNYVQITFDTLDAEGANMGTCLANTNTIDANGKWKFEAMCMDESADIAEVRFKEITGF